MIACLEAVGALITVHHTPSPPSGDWRSQLLVYAGGSWLDFVFCALGLQQSKTVCDVNRVELRELLVAGTGQKSLTKLQ